MSSPVEPLSVVMVRRLADGTLEWIPLEAPQRVPVAPEVAYTLVDRASYESPQSLVAERVGQDLVLEVQGTEVLVLERFFAATGVAFYPTTDIAGGAGPFSGTPLTPVSPVLAASPAGEQVVWSADPSGEGDGAAEEIVMTGAGAGSGSPFLWVGAAAGGLALAALAGGGGGSGGGEADGVGAPGEAPAPAPSPAPAPDSVAPQITSAATAPAIAENSGAGQVIYTAIATDAGTVTYSLKAGGDAAAFSINGSTGAVTLTENPNHEQKSSYNFTVVATDAAGNRSERAVSLAINDLDEVAPTITSGSSAPSIVESSGERQVIYTVTSTDTGDISTGPITYSLGGVDAGFFSINANTGAVTLTGNPDFETKPRYSFTVVATDGAGNSSSGKAVTLAIADVTDEREPPGADNTAPALASSTPEDDAEDVPVGQNIVLTFSEDVRAGSGQIHIRDRGDNRTIDVTDVSQVSISGNTVTINPASDLNPDSTYEVQIDRGAFTDAAGNAQDRTTFRFATEQEDDDDQASSTDQSERTFQVGLADEVEIRVAGDDVTLAPAGVSVAAADNWLGAASLGSHDRIMLVANRTDTRHPPAQTSQTSSVEAPVTAQTGVVLGTSLARVATGNSADATLFDLANMPAGILTSQGLV